MVSFEDRILEHRQGQIFTRTWLPAGEPAGCPVILFHDSLGCTELWREFPAVFAKRTRRCVISYDRSGFGKSNPRNGRPGFDFIGDEARTWVPVLREGLGIDRFAAFGHSVGGSMAAQVAVAFVDSCEALITESTQAFVEDRTLAGIREAQRQFEQPEQLARLRRYHGEKTEWVLDAWTGIWLDPAFSNWSLAEVMPRVRCPLLVIHGADDEYGSNRHAELIASLAGGPSRLEVIEDTRHVPHREREAEVVAMVAEFLTAQAPNIR